MLRGRAANACAHTNMGSSWRVGERARTHLIVTRHASSRDSLLTVQRGRSMMAGAAGCTGADRLQAIPHALEKEL